MRKTLTVSGLITCVLVIAACAGRMPSRIDVASGASLTDMAGTWNMQTLSMTGDSVLVSYDIFATNDVTGWTLTFPGRDPIPVRVIEVAGDSVILDAGPYASALQQGVMVSTRFDMQLQGDSLSGAITAIYEFPDGRRTVPLRVRGRRAR